MKSLNENPPRSAVRSDFDPASRLLLTVKEVAHRLSMSRAACYPIVMRGEIESVMIGRSRRIPINALEKYIDQLRAISPNHPGESR